MESYTNLSGAPAKARKNAAAWEQLWYFTKGLKQGLPIALGYFPSALAYGVMALARRPFGQADYTDIGSGVFRCRTVHGCESAVWRSTALGHYYANLVVNLRYFVMSASFSRRLNVNWLQAAIIGFGVTDETFVMNYLADLEKPALSGSPLGERHRKRAGSLPAAKLCAGSEQHLLRQLDPGYVCRDPVCRCSASRFGAGMGIILYAMFIALLIPAAAGSWGIGGVAAAGGALC